jgi:hypothetical protein
MGPVPLFVELCAGTAALSLRLQQRKARPPVSRMGAKSGYADAILRVLGLRAGQKADHYLWCEPDAGCRLLLEAYRDRALALAAAEIIRSWADEEPRALWERLRAEGPPVCPPADAREVARWVCYTANRVYGDGGFAAEKTGAPGNRRPAHTGCAGDVARLPPLPATITPDARTVDPREVARWVNLEGWTNSGRYMGPDRPSACHPPGWVASITSGGLARRAELLPTLPATIADDARTVDPREVARWAVVQARTYGQAVAFGPGGGTTYMQPAADGGRCGPTAATLPARFMAHGLLPATIADDARPIEPGTLPPGTVAYMDPPYQGTTGYAADLGRAEVVALARRWDAAGAVVCISEAEPIPELVADGWHAVEITGARVGQKRTFSKQQAEWLTLNRPPAWTVPVQTGLFG